MKRRFDFRTWGDWEDFARSPRPLKRSELKAAARVLARIAGKPEDEVVASLYLEQTREASVTLGYDVDPAPLGMDLARYRLHQDARALAQARVAGNPRLDAGEAYQLASIEIADRANPSPI